MPTAAVSARSGVNLRPERNSREADAIIAYAEASSIAHRVTSTFRSQSRTAAGRISRHAVGLAVDFAGAQPSRDSEALAAIFGAFAKVREHLYELIYAGPQVRMNVKAGRWVPKYAQDIHHDHVHVSANRGVLLQWEDTRPPALFPSRPEERKDTVVAANRPPVAILAHDQDSYWIVTDEGGVFAIGDAPFYGSLGGTQLNAPIVGAAVAPDHEGYWLLGGDGGVFAFGSAGFTGNVEYRG